MVKHIILWTLNPELSESEKESVKAGIKEGLEGLVGKVPGLIDVKVNISGRLASSNADAPFFTINCCNIWENGLHISHTT